MPLAGVKCGGSKVSIQDCLDCELDFDCPARPFRIVMLDQKVYGHGDYVSTTLLTGCPLQSILKREKPYYADLNSFWYMTRGTIYHLVAEGAKKSKYWKHGEEFAEIRWKSKIGNPLIRSTSDYLRLYKTMNNTFILYDFKTTMDMIKAVGSIKDYYLYQGNIYRLGLINNGYKVGNLRFMFMDMAGWKTVKYPVVPEQKVIDYVNWKYDCYLNRKGTPSGLCKNFCPVKEYCEFYKGD